jgi:uncharacterized membrane protein
MIDPAIGALLSGAFALLFASAALHKVLNPGRLAQTVRAYAVVPPVLVRASLLVPLLELTVGAGLLVRSSRPWAAVGGAFLLVAYGAAIAINLQRGRHELSCGCGWASHEQPIGTWMVWRNFFLAALLSALWWPWTARGLRAADALTVVAGVVVLALLYASLDALLSRVVPRASLLRGSS